MLRARPCGGVAFTWALLVLCGPTFADDLVGRWVHNNGITLNTLTILPDGHYAFSLKVGDQVLNEHGTFTVAEGKLTLKPSEGEAKTYQLTRNGEKVTLNDGVFPAEYARQAGSAEAVVAEARQAAAAKADQDAMWQRRFATAAAKPRANIAVGDVPEDPHPEKVFENATAFAEQQQYVRFWNPTIFYRVERGPDPGGGRPQTRLHFLPNGRFHYVNIAYTGAAGEEGQLRNGTVTVTREWGRYTIEPGRQKSALTMKSDKGEDIACELIDGHRNLSWPGAEGRTIYGNVVWELEALKQAQKPVRDPVEPAPNPADPEPAVDPAKAAAINQVKTTLQQLRTAIKQMEAAPGANEAALTALRQAATELETKLAEMQKPEQ